MPQASKWENYIAWTGAVLVAALFLLAGIWKMTDPIEAAARLAQAKVPGFLSEFGAVAFGIAETFSAILILIPRYRKLGAYFTGLMLIAFMIWVGYFYNDLQGKECSCFPWIKRAVGPGFFIGDGVMLAMAVAAGWWSKLSFDWKRPAMILSAVTLFAVSSYAYALSQQTGAVAPESVQLVTGETHKLREGRQAIYFYDPQCMHCFHAAQAMSKLDFTGTAVLGIPTEVKQFAGQFLKDTGFTIAKVSNDTDKLKKAFPFGDPPFLVLLENGRQKAAINKFDEPAFTNKIVELGFAKMSK